MRQSHIAIIGAPMDLGAGRRGVDMGPSALRLAGLNEKLAALGYEVEDLGNVHGGAAGDFAGRTYRCPLSSPDRAYLRTAGGDGGEGRGEGRVPLVLGGDHSAGHRHRVRNVAAFPQSAEQDRA